MSRILAHLRVNYFLLLTLITRQTYISSIGSVPKAMSFFEKLSARVESVNSLLCVGLDPHESELFPQGISPDTSETEKSEAAFKFCTRLIRTTAPYAACYKPNAAFFEAIGPNLGAPTLVRVLKEIPSEIPILLDVKRGDIGSTASAYADACYDIGADAVTLSPLMGWDSVAPFVTGKYADKGAFLLCKTSNPGSNDLLTLSLSSQQTLYEKIAQLSNVWSAQNGAALGLVVGATDPEALRLARRAAGDDVWILAPGVGAQGGDLIQACQAGFNSKGKGLLIPVSRGISQASDPSAAAKELRDMIYDASRNHETYLGGECHLNASGNNTDIQLYQKEFIEFSLAEGVLKFGEFILKSGRTSPYFFNAGLFSTGAALHKLGKAYAAAIMSSQKLVRDGNVTFDIIFGPAYKGISLGAVVAAALYSEFGLNLGFAYNRKEAKDHGEGGVLVGASLEEKRVLIIDDVITAGTAIRESYDLLVSIKAKVMGVIIALDRAEKRSLDDPVSAVQAVERDLSVPVESIVSLPQLQSFLENNPNYGDEILIQVSNYREQYGVEI